MQDLKDTTQDVHYENFRAQCISQMSQMRTTGGGVERVKLKRDSVSSANDSVASDTDRLLLQKDEEVCIRFDIIFFFGKFTILKRFRIYRKISFSSIIFRFDECKICWHKCKRN